MTVKLADKEVCKQMVLQNHYSRRAVGARHAFGLFNGSNMIGCILYSQPASYTLCKGVCGLDFKPFVLELSRLVILGKVKNAASFLIGNSLKMLGDNIIVSYADCNDHVGHVGYVYQATNWIYTGNASAEPAWLHPETKEVISYTRRHIDEKAARLGLHWKELIKQKQIGKHRYITFTGSKTFRHLARKNLKYPVMEYPKGKTRRHETESISE